MADRLTQLQDSVDQIATQFFSALRYVATRHDAAPVANEAKLALDEGRVVDPPEVFECTSPPLPPAFYTCTNCCNNSRYVGARA
jgi:mediator of RNA polymerase II transcription subunit 21